MKTPLTDQQAIRPETAALAGAELVVTAEFARTLELEVARWKKNIIPFLAVHAGTYGRDHYGEGCMHFTHYDMLTEAGGRMDDFERCGDTTPAAPQPTNEKR